MQRFITSPLNIGHLPQRTCFILGGLGLIAALASSPAREFGLLMNTLWLVGWVELCTLPVAISLAMLIARSNLAYRNFMAMLLGSLVLVPLYLQLCGWDAAFGVLGWCTMQRVPRTEPLLAGFRAAVVIHTVVAIPWGAWLMAALFRYGRREWEEQALLDGNESQVWRCVTLPQLASGVLLATVWIFILTAGEMTVTNIYLVRTYAENVYSHFAGSGDLEAVLPHVAALLLFTISLVFCSLGAMLALPANLQEARAYQWSLTSTRFLCSAFAICGMTLLIGFPLVNLITQAGMQVTALAGKPERTWSLVAMGKILMLTPHKFSREFVTTVLISTTVMTLALLLGGGFAWVTRRNQLLSAIAWLFAAMGLALPGPLIAIAVIRLLNQPHSPLLLWLYDRTIAPPVIALLVRCVPVAYLGLWWAWRSLDSETLATAELEGANAWRRFVSIALPQRLSVVISLAVMIFAIASGDISVSLLTLPPGMSTIAQRMFGLVHSGVNDQVAGLGLMSWAVYLGAGVFFTRACLHRVFK